MKISVVMATYNGAKYLKEQLDSILGQTLRPDEIIVCDDQSNDDTESILEGYQRQGYLSYYRNGERYGVVKNFKRAASLASADSYIAFSDQDDIWEPHKLKTLADALRALEVGGNEPYMVYSDLVLINEQNIVLDNSFRRQMSQQAYQHNLETLLFANFVNGCTALINPALNKMFADAPDVIKLNHDGWLALLAYTFGKAMYLDEQLVRYRKHSDNVSIQKDMMPANRFIKVWKELLRSLNGDSRFIGDQFETVQQFYEQYCDNIPATKKVVFDRFLKLRNQPYVMKKFAFGRTVRKYKL